MPFKELDEQIEKIRQRVEDLSGNRKELCRKSFMIQSEEIKNDIKELRKKLVNKKEEIKEKEKEVNKLEEDLNGLVLSDSKLYKKSYLENLYFISAIVIGSIPIMSLLGLLFLYIYLYEIKASVYFGEIASDGGLGFSFVTGAVIFIFFLLCPIIILGLEGSKKNNNIELKSTNLLIIIYYLVSIVFSITGFYIFFDNHLLFVLFFSLLWNVLIFWMAGLCRKIQINSKIYLVPPVVWLIIMLIALPLSSIFSTDFSLKNVFEIIEFKQKDYSWFRVNKSYFDRTGLTVSDIKVKEKEFTDDTTATYSFSSDGKSVFLYGKLWVNSKNVKILCPPVFEQDDRGQLIIDKGKPKTLDKNPDVYKNPDGHKKCIRFQSKDLQDMSGLTELLKKGQ